MCTARWITSSGNRREGGREGQVMGMSGKGLLHKIDVKSVSRQQTEYLEGGDRSCVH